MRPATIASNATVPTGEAIANSNLFLLHWCHMFRDEIVNHANGSTFLEISKGNFRRISTFIPREAVIHAFDSYARPLHERIVSNERESLALATQSDALRRSLLSGGVPPSILGSL